MLNGTIIELHWGQAPVLNLPLSFILYNFLSPSSSPDTLFHSTATQLPAPLGCHNTAHITWGDSGTERSERPRGQGAAAAKHDCYLMVWGDGYHM